MAMSDEKKQGAIRMGMGLGAGVGIGTRSARR